MQEEITLLYPRSAWIVVARQVFSQGNLWDGASQPLDWSTVEHRPIVSRAKEEFLQQMLQSPDLSEIQRQRATTMADEMEQRLIAYHDPCTVFVDPELYRPSYETFWKANNVREAQYPTEEMEEDESHQEEAARCEVQKHQRLQAAYDEAIHIVHSELHLSPDERMSLFFKRLFYRLIHFTVYE